MEKNKPGSTKMWKNGEDGRGTSDNNIYSFSSVRLKKHGKKGARNIFVKILNASTIKLLVKPQYLLILTFFLFFQHLINGFKNNTKE